MRKLVVKIWVLPLLLTLSAQAQKEGIHFRESVVSHKKKDEDQKKGRSYTFKSFKQKKLVVTSAYMVICKKLEDANYPKEKLEQEKKAFICLLKGKIELGDENS
jgi:hypothetical protein